MARARFRKPRVAVSARQPAKPAAGAGKGFIRYDLHILAALIVVILVVVVPRFVREGWTSAALGLLTVLGFVLCAAGCLLLSVWLQGNVGRAGTGWRDQALRGVGHLLRFSLFGFVGLVVATALVAQHRLGPVLEAAIPLSCAAACGFAGLALHRRLGKERFWPAFAKLGLTLVASLFGGMLGILGPEPWAVDAGIAVPILLFALLAALGRVVPRREAAPKGPGSEA